MTAKWPQMSRALEMWLKLVKVLYTVQYLNSLLSICISFIMKVTKVQTPEKLVKDTLFVETVTPLQHLKSLLSICIVFMMI
jgi:hypothetical protein